MIWIHSAVGWVIFAVVIGLIWYFVGKDAVRDVTSSDKNDQGPKYSDKD
jgi:hypothetical protein